MLHARSLQAERLSTSIWSAASRSGSAERRRNPWIGFSTRWLLSGEPSAKAGTGRSDQADSRDIKHRFRNSVYSQVPLDQRVLECGGAEGRQSQPRCREAKRLTEMAGLEQNDPIRPGSAVLPHGPGKDRCHDEQRRRPDKIGLTRTIRACHARTYFGREFCQTVVPGLVVIHPPLEPVHPERHQIYLARVPGTAGRACLVRKSSEYIRLEVSLDTPRRLQQPGDVIQGYLPFGELPVRPS